MFSDECVLIDIYVLDILLVCFRCVLDVRMGIVGIMLFLISGVDGR